MSRTMIAALTLVAVAACGGGDRGDTATADSLSRDLQLAPVDTTAELNDQTSEERPTASTTTPAPRRTSPSRPSTPSAPRTAAPAPTTPRSLAAGTTLTASTNAEIRSHKNKVGDTVTATIASDVKDRSGRVVIPAGSEVVLKVTAIKESENKSDKTGTLTVQPTSVIINGQSYPGLRQHRRRNDRASGPWHQRRRHRQAGSRRRGGRGGRARARRQQQGRHHRRRARWGGRRPAGGRDQGPRCRSPSGHDRDPGAVRGVRAGVVNEKRKREGKK